MIEKQNDVIYFTRLHWIILFWPMVFLAVVLYAMFSFPTLHTVGLFLAAFALLWLLMSWFTYYFSSITIKKNQIILRTGVLVRQILDIPLNKIEAIDIRQSIFGSLLGYGMLRITGTGGTQRVINYLHHPLTCRRYIEQLMGNAG